VGAEAVEARKDQADPGAEAPYKRLRGASSHREGFGVIPRSCGIRLPWSLGLRATPAPRACGPRHSEFFREL
jgi:hypothetical protein